MGLSLKCFGGPTRGTNTWNVDLRPGHIVLHVVGSSSRLGT